MDYFNKEEFEQLKNLPRAANQKRETMDRIRKSRSGKQTRNYPIKYVGLSIVVILLTILLTVSEVFSPTEQQANEMEQLKDRKSVV